MSFAECLEIKTKCNFNKNEGSFFLLENLDINLG